MASKSLRQTADFLENFKVIFDQNIPDRLKCILCKSILINSKQTSCGCKVCDKCISDYLKDSERRCPSNLIDCADTKLMLNRDIHQDNATNKEISNLMVKCPFKSCDVTNVVRVMVTHIDVCEYRDLICDKCSKKYPNKTKSIHDKNECDQRIVECPFCKKTMAAIIRDTIHLNDDHVDLCSKNAGDCSNGCGVTNVCLKEHLKVCGNKKVVCPFQYLKCDVGKLTTAKFATHIQDEFIPHFDSLMMAIETLTESNSSLNDTVKRLQTITKEQNDVIQNLTESRIKMEWNIDELRKRSPGSASTADKSIIFRNAAFIWKISDFEGLKADAERGGRASVTSEPFYTSEFGYKMCLRVYPAGDGVGRGNNLSVFFAIMKGDYDDLLSWPFKQKVTLSLLDQENYVAKNHSDTFKPDARSACYQKPVEDCNIASGSTKFIALSELLPRSIFYKNDSIILKLSVNVLGISKLELESRAR